MSRKKALALAVFTFWPPLYMLLFMGAVFAMAACDFFEPERAGDFPLIFKIIFPLHFLTILEILVLIAIYTVYLFKTDRVRQDKKALWAVVLFLGNAVTMPVFWYLYIWKEPQTASPPSASLDKK